MEAVQQMKDVLFFIAVVLFTLSSGMLLIMGAMALMMMYQEFVRDYFPRREK